MITSYTRPRHILPFDHRASFLSSLFGWKEPLTEEQRVAVGRTTFWQPLVYVEAKRLSKLEATTRFAQHHKEWIQLFEQSHSVMASKVRKCAGLISHHSAFTYIVAMHGNQVGWNRPSKES